MGSWTKVRTWCCKRNGVMTNMNFKNKIATLEPLARVGCVVSCGYLWWSQDHACYNRFDSSNVWEISGSRETGSWQWSWKCGRWSQILEWKARCFEQLVRVPSMVDMYQPFEEDRAWRAAQVCRLYTRGKRRRWKGALLVFADRFSWRF